MINEDSPILLQADYVEYYDKNNIAIAGGNVFIVQNNEIIKIDKVIYNRKERLIDGYGNVVILEKNGNIIFADKILIKDDLSHGNIENFSSRLKNGSLFVAKDANIITKDHYQLNKALFTSCPVCNNRSPQWQLKSYKVEIDKNKQRVKYQNAFFEIYGFPIFYTPYFSHPTNDVERQSGLLTPSYGNNSNLGSTLKIPYYISISPSKELVISPLFTSTSGIVIDAEFKHLTKMGLYNLGGSFANKKIKNTKMNYKNNNYHIYGNGNFKINDKFSAGFSFTKVSNKNYLKDYGFLDDKDFLTSIAYLNYDKKDEFTSIKIINFKSLIQDNNSNEIENKKSPAILPYIDYHLNKNAFYGMRYDLDANFAGLKNKFRTSYDRGSITQAISVPYNLPNGNLFKLTSSLRTDLYHINNKKHIGRILPEIKLNWRLPLFKKNDNHSILLEPISNIIWSPSLSNNKKIPNQDSATIELYDDNLFNSNHFAGYDRVETGPRANYGIRSAVKTKNHLNFDVLIGQYYHFKKNAFYLNESGMKNRLSDYVGRISANPIKMLDLNYRFLWDKKTFRSKRDEIDIILKLDKIHFNVTYAMLRDVDFKNKNFSTKRQILVGSNIYLTDRINLNINMRRNILVKKNIDSAKRDNSIVALGGEMIYKGDCTDVIFQINKDYTDKNAKTGKVGLLTWTINIPLKNLTN